MGDDLWILSFFVIGGGVVGRFVSRSSKERLFIVVWALLFVGMPALVLFFTHAYRVLLVALFLFVAAAVVAYLWPDSLKMPPLPVAGALALGFLLLGGGLASYLLGEGWLALVAAIGLAALGGASLGWAFYRLYGWLRGEEEAEQGEVPFDV